MARSPILTLPVRFRDGLRELVSDPDVDWYDDPGGSLKAAVGAEVLWHDGRTAAPLDQLLDRAPALRWLHMQNVGVDRTPLAAISRRRIRLTNGAGLYAVPIAEYAVMAMLAAAKGFRQLLAAQERGEWLTVPPGDSELFETRALIIGYGQIGRAIGSRLRGLGVTTVGVRSRARSASMIGPDRWRERLGEFDWVIVSAPLTAATDHMIGAAELTAMKPGAWVLNVSRGAIIDTPALLHALEAGSIAGAYLDVTDPEPLPAGHPLWQRPNVIVTPHSSYASHRFLERAGALFLDNLRRYRAGAALRNLVKLRAGY
ncbi:MAG: D-2-hydroxyacid dehydrogenase [Candidatus Nephthysia bennettiae]|uniref:D-2-hydroxyacid dehydrogenase n=1 Tax=Candidatus Nephthysia bennettiae TaxID=3127016 RepID=A0A934NFD9_9BACT|nr:D-2-hydroxyacid dehydrogenase [Candidatus Dormibacteraeota bacterium]MBJ7612386.1 D-2-hydroxyacid dehydrogenase [Candidatus Dormibacteraeota bacterium]PZR88437.1 MAG: D-2-hydroxyacid dehydrogenase [Candidatus Dormibacteraeota bacterium]